MNSDSISFVSRWLNKADNYNTEELSECFDQFFSLFVAYNRIYSEVKLQLKETDSGDKVSATKNIYIFLRKKGQKNLTAILPQDEYNNVIRMIEDEMYWIDLDNEGRRQREKDLQLLKNLKSNGPKKKTIAILTTIYYVRCNLFHGNKEFIQYQKPLLTSLSKILKAIINELLRH